MDKLPNELHDMIASNLSSKDIKSYRLVSRHHESIANRHLFQTARFVFPKTLPQSFTFRPEARFISRLHIDTLDSDKSSYDKAMFLEALIQDIHSAGANITKLCFEVGETCEHTVDENGVIRQLPIMRNNVEAYMTALASCAPLLSNVTHFQIAHIKYGGGLATTQLALSSLLHFLKSLPRLECIDMDLRFEQHVNRYDLEELWKIFLAHDCSCKEQGMYRHRPWHFARVTSNECSCPPEAVWTYDSRDGYQKGPFSAWSLFNLV